MHPPIYVTDLELGSALRPLVCAPRYTAVRALVRLHGEPLGHVPLPLTNGTVSVEEQAHAIHTHLSEPVLRACLRNGLREPLSEHGMSLATLQDAPPPAYTGPTPLVTVAVCSRDRPDDVRRCLRSLQHLRYPHLDVLLVDNAPSDDATRHVVTTEFPHVRYVREPRPGLNWARNRALREARGDIIAFTDDDVLVDPGWVDAFVPIFTSAPHVACVTGLVVAAELETRAQLLFEQYGGFERGFQRQWYTRAAHEASGHAVFHHGAGQFGTGANMAFRRSVFDTIGSFDPALDVGTATTGGGDLEMYFRVLQEGYTLVYEPRALVRHRHRRSMDALYRQIESWGRTPFAVEARSVEHYPAEKRGFRQMRRWWFRYVGRRLVCSLLGWSPLPSSLVWQELRTAWEGASSYRQARADAEAIRDTFGSMDAPVNEPTTTPNPPAEPVLASPHSS